MRSSCVTLACAALALGSCTTEKKTEPQAAALQDASVDVTIAPGDARAADAEITDAGPVDATVASDANASYGAMRRFDKGVCAQITRGGMFLPQFISMHDLTTSYVDGDDWLALVNRSPVGSLAPDYAPPDMVSVNDGSPRTTRQCETSTTCLRRQAYDAFREMRAEMIKAGVAPRVDSPFRSYWSQCGTFTQWADRKTSSFCQAAEQSALPGHSQHQLGTTVDMWTEDWTREDGGIFRDGFGCTRGGKWLAEQAWRYGWVVSYPIHPDDRHVTEKCIPRWDQHVPINPRTGYKHEAWHVRYIGKDNAKEFHDAFVASGPDTPDEITLEQFIRKKKGLAGDADLPVCDGCSCSACATLASKEEKGVPCSETSLRLGDDGKPIAPQQAPKLLDAKRGAPPKKDSPIVVVELKISVPPHTITQPPIMGDSGPFFTSGVTYQSLVPYKKPAPHRFDDLPGAWRVAIEPVPAPTDGKRWPWRASLAKSWLARTWNRANLYMPSGPGDVVVRMGVEAPPGTRALKVTLLRDGEEHDTRELPLQ